MTWAAIFVASLLGSLHCVGMCGGFVAVVANSGGRTKAMLTYQSARGTAYVLMGALAGTLGGALDQSAMLLGLHGIAGPLMGLSLIVLALTSLWPRRRPTVTPLLTLGRRDRPGLLARARLTLARSLHERGPRASAAAGLLTALLPCGWLWAYLLVAAGTRTPLAGAFTMTVFWLGTIPALMAVGVLAGGLGRRLGRHAPRVSAALMLLLGVLTLTGRLGPTATVESHQAERPTESNSGRDPDREDNSSDAPTTAPCH